MSLQRQQAEREVQAAFLMLSASAAADHLISPYVSRDLLNLVSSEPGTPMWIVNRSDVYDLTLQKLFEHPLPEISARAREKYSLRHSSLNFLSPPEDPGPLEAVPDHDVEEVLGHPLAPFEAMIHFAQSANEDHRATAALSLTRRLVEHPPNWTLNLELKRHITESFLTLLLHDSSQFARSYAARIPLFTHEHIHEALRHESTDFVLGRLLQNPATDPKALELFLDRFGEKRDQYPFAFAVALLDSRITEERLRFYQQQALDVLPRTIVNYQVLADRNSFPSM